jgi:hypothetical protein
MRPRAAAKSVAKRAAKSVTKPAADPTGLDETFDELKAILARYAKSFTVREGAVKSKRDYHLILEKPLVIDGRERKEKRFASIIKQKDSVGFYFTAMYGDVKSKLSPDLLKHLDGKSCFHMKSLTPGLKRDVDAALKMGMVEYEKRKWL